MASAYYCRDGCGETCAYSITTGGKTPPPRSHLCVRPLTLLFLAGFDNFDPVNGVTLELDENDCWDANAHLEEEGYTEFLTMQFEKAVYIKDIEIGENRGPMSTVAIEAYDYTTKTWMVMWSGTADLDTYKFLKDTQQFSVFLPYPLCQPSFKTDIVRIKQNTKAIDEWNEIDYVKLVGSEEATPGALPGASLVYERPRGGLDCVESFTFSMSDCGGQRTRLSEVQSYTILPAGGGTNACELLVEDVDEVYGKTEVAGLAMMIGIVGLTAIVAVQKFAKSKVTLEHEDELTLDEHMESECNALIRNERAWLCYEVVDALSDISNGVLVLTEFTKAMTFIILFSCIAVLSAFAGLNATVKRSQAINSFEKIRDGDKETMAKFKDGAGVDGKVTIENPILLWELVALEIHVCRMAIANGLVEDLPSLVVNVASILVALSAPEFKPSPQFYVSFGSALVSCATGGRKTCLHNKLRALHKHKGELELQTKKKSGGRKTSIVGGRLKVIGLLDEEGGLRGAEGVGKDARVVPVIVGDEINATEWESKDAKIARLEREKKEALEAKGAAEAREKAAQDQIEKLKNGRG